MIYSKSKDERGIPMNRQLCLLLAGVLAVVMITGCAKIPPPKEMAAQEPAETAKADTVRIGWIGALSGDLSVWGTCELNTIRMLAEEANKKGGWQGKTIEIIGYDTAGGAADAVSAVEKLTGQDHVIAIIGPNVSAQAIAISEALEAGKVASIATVATNPWVTMGTNGQVKPYNYRVCFVDSYQGAVAGSFMYDALGSRTAAILYDATDEYSQGLTAFFEKTFTEKGGRIVAKESFQAGELDFRAQLQVIKDSKPDIVFMPYFFKEVALSANQARELGIKVPMMGGDGWMSEQLLEMAGDALEGCYLINHLDVKDPAVAAYSAAYAAKYGPPAELNGFLAYDAFLMLEAAVEKAGTLDSQQVAEALSATDIQGITGTIRINPVTHNPVGKEAAIIKITDRNYQFLQKYSPE